VPRLLAHRRLDGIPVDAAAALWWDTARWPGFVEGFGHVVRASDGWPEPGGRLVWDSRPGGVGRVVEHVLLRAGYDADVAVEDSYLSGTRRVRFAGDGAGQATVVSLELDYAPKSRTPPLADLLIGRRRLRGAMERSLERLAREVADDVVPGRENVVGRPSRRVVE
jgi:hypothetical protein